MTDDGRAVFSLRAPGAQKVQVDTTGVKFDMAKGQGGAWTGTTTPLVPGFHYCQLVVDGLAIKCESPATSHEWLTWRRDLNDFAPRLFT